MKEEFNFGFESKRLLPKQIVKFKRRFYSKPQNVMWITNGVAMPEWLALKAIVVGYIAGYNIPCDHFFPTSTSRTNKKKEVKKNGKRRR